MGKSKGKELLPMPNRHRSGNELCVAPNPCRDVALLRLYIVFRRCLMPNAPCPMPQITQPPH